MDELLEHYKKAPIFTSEHGEKLYLIKPLQWPSTHEWALQPDQIWPHTEPSDLQLLLIAHFSPAKRGLAKYRPTGKSQDLTWLLI